MEFLTKSGTYTPYEPDCASLSRLEVYRLSEDEMREIEEQVMPPYAIMEFLGFEKPRYFVEPGAWYRDYSFISYNEITGLLVIENRESLNV